MNRNYIYNLFLVIVLIISGCKNKVNNSKLKYNNYIDTSDIETIFIYCNKFYATTDSNYPIGCFGDVKFVIPIKSVIATKMPYWILKNNDSIEYIEHLFLQNYTLIDSTEFKRNQIGEYFLLIKNKNKFNTMSYITDSIWIYNQKYVLKYSINPMHKLLEMQNAKSIDCITCDSVSLIK